MLPGEAPALPLPYVSHPEERMFETLTVTRGDIRFEANPFAIYMPARVVSQRFATGGVPVLGIYVAIGDEVSQGDIIAVLDMPEIQNELDELYRRYTRLNLEMDILTERHGLAQRLGSADNAAFLSSQSSMRAEIELLERLLAHIGYQNEERYLRATMDGIITDVATFVEGMVSDSRQAAAVISDQAFSSFVVQGESAELMNPGDRFEMTLANEIYLMEVIDPEEFGFVRDINPGGEGLAEAFLVAVYALAEDTDDPDDPDASAGWMGAATWYTPRQEFDSRGRIHMPLEEVLDVLHIPGSALHENEERRFVYVLENGLRAIRDVETGLEGGGLVEITSGLIEGDLVIQ